MTASDWVTLVIGIAGVISGLIGALSVTLRKPLIGVCVILIFIAVGIAVIRASAHTNSASTPTSGGSFSATPQPPTDSSPSDNSPSIATNPPSDVGPASPSATLAASHPTGPPVGTPLAGPEDNSTGGTIVNLWNEDDLNTDATGIDINGKSFNDSFEGRCNALCPTVDMAWLEFDFGRKYKTLKATFGIDDDSLGSTQSASIEVIADNAILYKKSFSLGESQNVNLNVTGVLRLRIQFTGPMGTVFPAVGDPTVY